MKENYTGKSRTSCENLGMWMRNPSFSLNDRGVPVITFEALWLQSAASKRRQMLGSKEKDPSSKTTNVKHLNPFFFHCVQCSIVFTVWLLVVAMRQSFVKLTNETIQDLTQKVKVLKWTDQIKCSKLGCETIECVTETVQHIYHDIYDQVLHGSYTWHR